MTNLAAINIILLIMIIIISNIIFIANQPAGASGATDWPMLGGEKMPTVLIIDDAAFMRAALKQTLTQYGYCVIGEACDGKDGVNQYLRKQPDIVMMDLAMPEMDGLTALREIKKIDSNAKVIMCSSVKQTAMVVEAVRAGASDFITKPVESVRLIAAIKRITGTAFCNAGYQ